MKAQNLVGAADLTLCDRVWVFHRRSLLPDADAVIESDSFDIPDGQTLISHLQWEDSPDISPTDSASSKASKKRMRITRKNLRA